MRIVLGSLAAAVCGGTAVWIAFWVFESIVPQGPISIPLEVSSLAIMIAVLLAGTVLVRHSHVVEAAALFAGSASSWALHSVHPLTICQSDSLYRECTASEIAWMALPAVVLLIASAGLSASAVVRKRTPR